MAAGCDEKYAEEQEWMYCTNVNLAPHTARDPETMAKILQLMPDQIRQNLNVRESVLDNDKVGMLAFKTDEARMDFGRWIKERLPTFQWEHREEHGSTILMEWTIGMNNVSSRIPEEAIKQAMSEVPKLNFTEIKYMPGKNNQDDYVWVNFKADWELMQRVMENSTRLIGTRKIETWLDNKNSHCKAILGWFPGPTNAAQVDAYLKTALITDLVAMYWIPIRNMKSRNFCWVYFRTVGAKAMATMRTNGLVVRIQPEKKERN